MVPYYIFSWYPIILYPFLVTYRGVGWLAMNNHGSVKNGCISNRIVTFQKKQFSTSMVMRERVILPNIYKFTPPKLYPLAGKSPNF